MFLRRRTDSGDDPTWEGQIDIIRELLANRSAWLDENLWSASLRQTPLTVPGPKRLCGLRSRH